MILCGLTLNVHTRRQLKLWTAATCCRFPPGRQDSQSVLGVRRHVAALRRGDMPPRPRSVLIRQIRVQTEKPKFPGGVYTVRYYA